MVEKMIIRSIKIENFRGFRNKTIAFKDQDVVLLTAPNGIGKTTVIDAIEWCLTGSIGRLKTAFDIRSTNEAEREINTTGILKHRDAEKNDFVCVQLVMFDGLTETVLRRTQREDFLSPKLSRVVLVENEQQDEQKAEQFIKEYVESSFYQHHFCDVQKSFNIQSTKRSALTSLFSEFITNYDDQNTIANNLDIFVEDVKRYIEDIVNKKKEIEPAIKEKEKRLSEVQEASNLIPYPSTKYYPDENTEIANLNLTELNAQKEKITTCGYIVAQNYLSLLAKNDALKRQKEIINKIIGFRNSNIDVIHRAEKKKITKNTSSIVSLENKLHELKSQSITKANILCDNALVDSVRENIDINIFDAYKAVIIEKEQKVKTLSKEIELLSNNNKMLELLSVLSANKKEIINYREKEIKEKGSVHCPLCGSEAFANVDEASILKEADKYIKQNGEFVGDKTNERARLQIEIDALYQKLLSIVKTATEKTCKSIEVEVVNRKKLYEEVLPYLDLIDELQRINDTITLDELTDSKILELLAVVDMSLLDESKEKDTLSSYQQVLTVLGYKYENESAKQTLAKIKSLISDPFEVSNFSYDTFVAKLNAISGILNNHILIDISNQIDEEKKEIIKLDERITEFETLRKTAEDRATEIRNTISALSSDEYEKVGPALTKYFNKLSRLNFNEGIKVEQKDEKVLLVDSKGKNIVNVLSNGQISVFMLAYFFAGISVRNQHEELKIFFIDDLTACMDDINMLAFIDLLKYQMTSKATIDQLFFVTCDNRISKLLEYKFDGHKIKYLEIDEQLLKE